MKVIDLLNKIANGEEVHAKHKLIEVKYYGENDFGISYRTGNQITFKDLIRILNDEVEIIEEDNKIYPVMFMGESEIEKLGMLKDKINEIIDKLNEGE